MTTCGHQTPAPEAEEKIQNLAKKRNRNFRNLNLPPHPVWWNYDQASRAYDNGFQFKWGSMGVITASLSNWIKEELGIASKKDLDAIMWEYQFIILQCSKACWNARKNHRPPELSHAPSSAAASLT